MADQLTDTEIVAACARAIGIECDFLADTWRISPYHNEAYNPLTDRAQAMELVEMLRPDMRNDDTDNGWLVHKVIGGIPITVGPTIDLLRAICLCAARVQIEKEKNANG